MSRDSLLAWQLWLSADRVPVRYHVVVLHDVLPSYLAAVQIVSRRFLASIVCIDASTHRDIVPHAHHAHLRCACMSECLRSLQWLVAYRSSRVWHTLHDVEDNNEPTSAPAQRQTLGNLLANITKSKNKAADGATIASSLVMGEASAADDGAGSAGGAAPGGGSVNPSNEFWFRFALTVSLLSVVEQTHDSDAEELRAYSEITGELLGNKPLMRFASRVLEQAMRNGLDALLFPRATFERLKRSTVVSLGPLPDVYANSVMQPQQEPSSILSPRAAAAPGAALAGESGTANSGQPETAHRRGPSIIALAENLIRSQISTWSDGGSLEEFGHSGARRNTLAMHAAQAQPPQPPAVQPGDGAPALASVGSNTAAAGEQAPSDGARKPYPPSLDGFSFRRPADLQHSTQSALQTAAAQPAPATRAPPAEPTPPAAGAPPVAGAPLARAYFHSDSSGLEVDSGGSGVRARRRAAGLAATGAPADPESLGAAGPASMPYGQANPDDDAAQLARRTKEEQCGVS